MTSAEENEIYLRGTISVLLCWDGLESQTSSYRFVEWSVCGSCKAEEFSDYSLDGFWFHFRDTL